MDLRGALSQECFVGKTDEECLAYGNAVIEIARSTELWSYSGVAARYGTTVAETIMTAIRAKDLRGLAYVYTGNGIDLSLEESQQRLTEMAGVMPELATVFSELKEIGITHGMRWKTWGIETSPTVEEIAAARAAIETEAALQWLSTTFQAVIAGWRAGQISSIAEAKAWVAAAERE